MDSRQNQSVLEEFKRRRRLQLALTIPLIALIGGAFIFQDKLENGIPGVPSNAGFIILFGIFVFAMVFSLSNWRCPSCNVYLGKNWSPKFCPKCGIQLQ